MNIYDEIVSGFNINEGDNLWISSELLKLIIVLKKVGIKFDGDELINAFQRKVTNSGTIMIPTFNFDFSNKGYYDIVNSKGTTGALGNIALGREDFKRTKHPMHSFAVWGKNQELLINMNNKHAFGVDSPFSFCIGHHVKQIILGTDYEHAMTFVHYVESICEVPYRFHKCFHGIYIDEHGVSKKKIYDYAARKLEIESIEQFNRIGKILEKQETSKKIDIFGIECYVIDLAVSFLLICKDVIENKCANIYDFNIPREQVFE